MKRMHDKKQLSGGVTEEQFEELVRATPTDVRAVVDQGQIQLQMEHDGNVLSIDDQFGKTINYSKWINTPFYRGYLNMDLFSCECDVNGNSETIDILIRGEIKMEKYITQQTTELEPGDGLADIHPFESIVLIDCIESDGTYIYYGMAMISPILDGIQVIGISLSWVNSLGQQQSINITNQAITDSYQALIVCQYGNSILLDA